MTSRSNGGAYASGAGGGDNTIGSSATKRRRLNENSVSYMSGDEDEGDFGD